MSRKKSGEGLLFTYLYGKPILLFVFAIVAFLLATATLLVGIWMMLAWIYREIALRNKTGNPKKFSSFTEDEQIQLAKLQNTKRSLRFQIDTIFENNSEVMRRQDGFFSERSYLGKSLNTQLQPLSSELEDTESKISKLNQVVQLRFSEWSHHQQRLSASRLSVLILLVCSLAFYYFEPAWIIAWGGYFGQISVNIIVALVSLLRPIDPLLDDLNANQSLAIGSIGASVWISFCSNWLTKRILASRHENLAYELPLHR